MKIRKHLWTIATGSVAAAAAVLGIQAPALAAWPADDYHCVVIADYPSELAEGTVSWGNRTASISGYVADTGGTATTTTVIFEAYAGSNKIDSQTRTANENSSLGEFRQYGFSIGDPNLAGGIDRMKITVRANLPDGDGVYSSTLQVHRDGTAENVANT